MTESLILASKRAYVTHLHGLHNETLDVYLISPDQLDDPAQGRRLFHAVNGDVHCDFPLFPELKNYLPGANLTGDDTAEPVSEQDLSTYLTNTRRHVLPLFKEERPGNGRVVVEVESGTENYDSMTATIQAQVTFYGKETFTAEYQVQLTPAGWETSASLSRPVDAHKEYSLEYYTVYTGNPTISKRVMATLHTTRMPNTDDTASDQWVESIELQSGSAPYTCDYTKGFIVPGVSDPLRRYAQAAEKLYRDQYYHPTEELPSACQPIEDIIRQVAEPVTITIESDRHCRWGVYSDDAAYVISVDSDSVDAQMACKANVQIILFVGMAEALPYPTDVYSRKENGLRTTCTIQPIRMIDTSVEALGQEITPEWLLMVFGHLRDYCNRQIERYESTYEVSLQNHLHPIKFK